MPKSVSVDAHLDALAHPARARIDHFRALIKNSMPGVTEGVKWNAPSYAPTGGDDRITFRLTPLPKLQLILHRGAKAKPPIAEPFRAPDGLIHWVAPDRGVIDLDREMPVSDAALADTLARWLTLPD